MSAVSVSRAFESTKLLSLAPDPVCFPLVLSALSAAPLDEADAEADVAVEAEAEGS